MKVLTPIETFESFARDPNMTKEDMLQLAYCFLAPLGDFDDDDLIIEDNVVFLDHYRV